MRPRQPANLVRKRPLCDREDDDPGQHIEVEGDGAGPMDGEGAARRIGRRSRPVDGALPGCVCR